MGLEGAGPWPGTPPHLVGRQASCGGARAWLHLPCRFLETPLLSRMICLLHTLWMTNLGDKEVQADEQPAGRPGPREPPKMLALHLVNEFLYVFLSLAKHLR